MRWVLVLALVGCPGRPRPIDRAAPEPVRFEPTPDAEPRAAPAPVETVEGPTSTPGRHPTIPRGPSTTSLRPYAIRRIIKQQMTPIVACYEQLSPGERRSVIIRFTIGPTGEVLSSTASGPQGEFENCIAAAFAGVTFDKPADGGTLTVSYPPHFRPG